jgi:hypothetical protein
MIAVSIIYALIEAYFTPIDQGNVISPYHILVFILGLVTGFDRNVKITTANVLMFSVLEDAFYWIFKHQLPYEWASEYVVFHHIPIYYIPYITLALVFYQKGLKHDKARVQS